jgi:alkylated DNA repair dioxygenase AlkB
MTTGEKWKAFEADFEENSWLHTCNIGIYFGGLIQNCIAEVKDKLISQPPIIIYGKTCHQRRDVGFFSDSVSAYNYSRGNEMKAQPIPVSLHSLLIEVNRMKKEKYGELACPFNAILVHRYNNGNDYISAHSDSGVYNKKCGVWSLSCGGTRTFIIRDKKTKSIIARLALTDGLLCEMGGQRFQDTYTHEVPREAKNNEPRMSFTFRTHPQE